MQWERRTASITDTKGNTIFEQKDVEVPVDWSMTATNIVASKYLHGQMGTPERETGVRQLVGRVAETIRDWGHRRRLLCHREDAAIFHDELAHMLLTQKVAFNSPVWFNVGCDRLEPESDGQNWHWDPATGGVKFSATGYRNPQCSACFINSVEDSLDSILTLAKTEGMLFKWGSGTGTNLSSIRGSKETACRAAAQASGPLSFMRGFDAFAGVIKSGGKTRRAAKMVILNVDHPDIMDFIECKAKEEAKAFALIKAGYDGSGPDSEAYSSIFFQNANNSVRVSDEFMRAYETRRRLHHLHRQGPRAGEDLQGARHHAQDRRGHLALRRSRHAVRHHHQQLAHQQEHGAHQRLQSLLGVHVPRQLGLQPGQLQPAEVRHPGGQLRHCRLPARHLRGHHGHGDPGRQLRLSHRGHRAGTRTTTARWAWATPTWARCSWPSACPTTPPPAAIWPRLSPPSCAARLICSRPSSPPVPAASPRPRRSLQRVERQGGACPGFYVNREPFLDVIRMHRAEVNNIGKSRVSGEPFNVPQLDALIDASRECWDMALVYGERYGYRNSQTTVLAPTGTIGFMMDCDTTGIEPDLALVKYKKLVGGGMIKIVNNTVPAALFKLGYNNDQVNAIVSYIDATGTIEGAPGIKPEHLAVFDCSFKPAKGTRSIHYMGHIKMMAAAQPFLSGAISKTVNLPHEATVEDVAEAYAESWRQGIKAVAIYRDGSKGTQPLNTSMDAKQRAFGARCRRQPRAGASGRRPARRRSRPEGARSQDRRKARGHRQAGGRRRRRLPESRWTRSPRPPPCPCHDARADVRAAARQRRRRT